MKFWSRVKNTFIPSQANNDAPFFLRHKALTAYAIVLVAVKVVVITSAFFLPLPSPGLAAVSVNDLISLTNQKRSENGLSTLSINSKLSQAANNKAQDMLARDYFSHNDPSGNPPWHFFTEAGYNYLYAGENLGIDFTESSELFNAWYASATHRANILNPNYKDIGIAVAEGEFQGRTTIIAVQFFGSAYQPPAEEPPAQPAPPAEKPPGPVSDQTPPLPPSIAFPENNSIMNISEITFSGTAEIKTTVNVFDNDQRLVSGLTDDENVFIMKAPQPLADGLHVFKANATDPAGNTSELSAPTKVTVDTAPPVINTNYVNFTPDTNANGSINLEISILVTGNPSEVKAAMADHSALLKLDGVFYKGTILNLPSDQAVTDIEFTAQDIAGNAARAVIKDFDINNPPPPAITTAATTLTDAANTFQMFSDQFYFYFLLFMAAALAVNIVVRIRFQRSGIIIHSLLVIAAAYLLLLI